MALCTILRFIGGKVALCNGLTAKGPQPRGGSELLDAGTSPNPLIIVAKSVAAFHGRYLSRSTTLFPYFSSALCT
jgi:hypothetical protein